MTGPGDGPPMAPGNRWLSAAVPRGADYDRRFGELAASGMDMHGEAAFVDSYGPGSVLDAGCGTGRVALELRRRGHEVVGVDLDPAMLEVARRKAPDLTWVEGDLADPGLLPGRQFDVVVMAGNVLLFVAPGTEGAVIANVARLLVGGGVAISGYSLAPSGLGVEAHDALAAAAGLELSARWSTWDGAPFGADSTYAVSVHRKSP
jgi:SAM-dependent methyltransferase